MNICLCALVRRGRLRFCLAHLLIFTCRPLTWDIQVSSALKYPSHSKVDRLGLFKFCWTSSISKISWCSFRILLSVYACVWGIWAERSWSPCLSVEIGILHPQTSRDSARCQDRGCSPHFWSIMSQVRLRLSPFQSQSRQCYLCWLSFLLHLHRVDIYKVTCILKSHHSVCPLGALQALGRNFPFSGGSLSLPHVLRVVFIETYQTVTLATLAGGCLASEMGAWAYSHQSVSGQTPRCTQSQTPISVFPRTALISVTFSEVGCSRCCCLTPGTTPPGSALRWRLTRPRRLRLTRGDPRLGGRSAQGHVSRWRRQRPSGKTDGVRDSARSGCQRGPSPAAEGAPPPHAPGRGTMASSEEDGGANGAVEEKENGKKKKKLGVLATTWLIFYNVAMTAGWAGAGGAAPPRARSGGARAARRGPGGAGQESRDAGEPPAAGLSSPAEHCLIRCSAAGRRRVTPRPPRRLSIAGTGMPGGGAASCGAASRMRTGLLGARGEPTALRGAPGAPGPGPREGRVGAPWLRASRARPGCRRAELSKASPARGQERWAGTGADRTVAQEVPLSLYSVLRGFAVRKEGI